MQRQIKRLVNTTMIFFVLLLPKITHANNANALNGGAGGAGGGGPSCAPGSEGGINLINCFFLNQNKTVAEVYNDPATLVNLLVNNIFVFAGIILFGIIVYAGFQFISGGSKGIDSAKQTLTTALIGFVMMFAAYWVVQIVEAMTGVSILF